MWFARMDLRHRWVIARQDVQTDWEFVADRGVWTKDFHRAVLFYTLWGAEEGKAHSAGGHGDVRNAADVADFAVPTSKTQTIAEAAA